MREIILFDNQAITNAGMRHLIEGNTNNSFIQLISTKRKMIQLLSQNPDSLVILDYTLSDFESVNELVILQMRFDKTNWILFSDELSEDFLRILLFNTKSFSIVLKDSSESEIVNALKESLNGNRYICSHVSNMLIDRTIIQNKLQPKQILTSTEQEILKEIALGKTTKEIATKRNVSVHTIMTHRKNIFRKIDVNNIHEATKYAMRAGIVDLAEYYI